MKIFVNLLIRFVNYKTVRIAIQAADLDSDRIDGTRVYILNLLRFFGNLDKTSNFFIYHKGNFNPELTPPEFANYNIKLIKFPYYWTQLRFAYEIWKDDPDVLWMPMQSMPFIRRSKLKTVVTIHDLAFKYFPDNFPRNDLFKLNILSEFAIKNSDKIIAVSHSTKQDILKFYPKIDDQKIKVIHHGFDPEIFNSVRDITRENQIKSQYSIKENYLLYVGAIQPRKNLIVLIDAFNEIKKKWPKLQLVLAGQKAWKWDKTISMASNSPFKNDIIMPGTLKFSDLGHIMRGAGVFVLPSLYEGFGIPVLEAFASGIPVITTSNSSLREIGGDAAIYFNEGDPSELAMKIEDILSNESLRNDLVKRGLSQMKKFSWEKCAKETLNYLKS